MASKIGLSSSVNTTLLAFNPLSPLKGFTGVAFPKPAGTRCRLTISASQRYNLGRLSAKDFPTWATKEPRAMKILHIIVETYKPIIKAQLILAAIAGVIIFLYQTGKDTTKLAHKTPQKVRSASAQAQALRREQMNEDLKALRAVVPFITTTKNSIIPASLDYINLITLDSFINNVTVFIYDT